MKQFVDVIAKPLTRIINVSLSSGNFPNSLKRGVIPPSITKQNFNCDVLSKNYRPITNIAYLSKILEPAVSNQLTSYLSCNNLFPRLQSSYRRFHSTETAVLCVLNETLTAMDNHQEVILVLLDLSSAFNTIDHKLLLQRLQQRYDIGGTALQLFKSYLLDRSQSVKVKDVSSSERKVLYGVPQSSVLGPLMFAMFFSPLEDVFHQPRFTLYDVRG